MMFRTILVVLLLAVVSANSASAGSEPVVGPDGLHLQSWFHESGGDVRVDLLTAAAGQKNLIILFEQDGCAYCERLHQVNFAHPEIVDLMTGNFLVVQMDLSGGDIVTDFDGAQSSEAKLARKWGVTTTPTTVVLLSENPSVSSLKQAEVFRLPGYLESFEYFSVLDFFASGAHETQALGPFMSAKAAEFTQRGIDPKTW